MSEKEIRRTRLPDQTPEEINKIREALRLGVPMPLSQRIIRPDDFESRKRERVGVDNTSHFLKSNTENS